MKNVLLLCCLLLAVSSFSQDSGPTDEEKIKIVIEQFFESLAAKDSVLMKETTLDDAQVWRRYNGSEPTRYDMRISKDEYPEMHTWPEMKESAISYKILVGEGMAMAWVPYTFWIEDTFSHCGVDVFTLFEIDGKWKIISTAYTVDKTDCN